MAKLKTPVFRTVSNKSQVTINKRLGTRLEKAAAREKFLNNLAQSVSPKASYYDKLMGYLRLDIEYKDHPSFSTKSGVKKLTSQKIDFDFKSVETSWNALFSDSKEITKAVKTKVLTPEQEFNLFLQLNYWKSQLARIVNSIQKKPRKLTAKEIRAALYYGEAVKNTRDALVVANLGLVYAMASRFNFGGTKQGPTVEVIAEGQSGLMRAVDRFDVGRGFKFSTYACRAILKALSRLRSKQIKSKEFISYDDQLTDQVVPIAEFAEDVVDIKSILKTNKANLNEQEQSVLQGRFFEDKKLYQVGDALGISKERVRQIQTKALKKLRKVMGIKNEA